MKLEHVLSAGAFVVLMSGCAASAPSPATVACNPVSTTQITSAEIGEKHAPNAGRAGEGQLPHPRIGQHGCCYRPRARGGDDVDDAGRHAGFLIEGGKRVGCQRRLAGRLQNDGAAGCKRRRDLARGHRRREIPWRYQNANANGLIVDHDPVRARRGKAELAADANRFLRVPPEETRLPGGETRFETRDSRPADEGERRAALFAERDYVRET